MKKRNVLSSLRETITIIHGKSPNRQIILCRIAGISANGRRIPTNIKSIETNLTHHSKKSYKSLTRKKH